MGVLEFMVTSLLVKTEPKTIAIPHFKISRKYVEVLSDIRRKKKKTYKFFHYAVLLGPEHCVLLPDSKRGPQKILFYFSELLCVFKQGTFLY